MLAYRGKKKQLVNILSFTKTGAVKQYEPYDQPGNRFMPLVENGKNVEKFEIVENEQMSIFDLKQEIKPQTVAEAISSDEIKKVNRHFVVTKKGYGFLAICNGTEDIHFYKKSADEILNIEVEQIEYLKAPGQGQDYVAIRCK